MNKLAIFFIYIHVLLLGNTVQAMDHSEGIGKQLHTAVLLRKLLDVGRLIDQGTPIDVKDSLGQTPLMVAAWAGWEDICEGLIMSKAAIDEVDSEGKTALLWAAYCGREQICKLLIKNKATININTNKGFGPLFYAAQNNLEEICELMIDTQLEQAKQNKRAIITFLRIKRKRKTALWDPMPYDVAKLIAKEAHQAVIQDRLKVIAQINQIPDQIQRQKLLNYLNQQLTSNLWYEPASGWFANCSIQ